MIQRAKGINVLSIHWVLKESFLYIRTVGKLQEVKQSQTDSET